MAAACATSSKQQCHGLTSKTRTHKGHTVPQCWSGLQKFARLKMAEQGRYCVHELLLLSRATGPGSKAIETSAVNRIVVSYMEDCLHPSTCDRMLAMYADVSRGRDPAAIRQMYDLVVAADKGRLPSIVKIFKDPHALLADDAFRAAHGRELEVDGADDKGSHRTFVRMIMDKDMRAARFMPPDHADAFRLIREASDAFGVDTHPGLRAAIDRIWRLHRMLRDNNGKGHESVVLSLYQALAWVVLRDEIDFVSPVPAAAAASALPDDFLDAHSSDDGTPPLDFGRDYPFVIDVHTHEGRRMGKNAVDFATEGSRVVDEAAVSARFRTLYVDSKLAGQRLKRRSPTRPTPEKNNNNNNNNNNKTRKKRAAEEDAHERGVRPRLVRTKVAISTASFPELAVEEFVPLKKITRSRRPMTYLVTAADGTKSVVKRLEEGCAPILFDRLKRTLGIRGMNVSGVTMKKRFVTVRDDDAKDAPVVHKIVDDDEARPFFRMDFLGDARLCKDVPDLAPMNRATSTAMLRILMSRALFRVSDFCPTNCMIDADGAPVGIDENQWLVEGAAAVPHSAAWRKLFRGSGIVRADVEAESDRLVVGVLGDARRRDDMVEAMSSDGLVTEAEARRILSIADRFGQTLGSDVAAGLGLLEA